jgi:hypothetical protein
MSIVAVLVAGVVYFMLGGLWFTPLFGKQWDRAVGFTRPEKWTPSAIYYIGPLLGCLAGALAIAVLMMQIQPSGLVDAAMIGLTAGLGFGFAITGTNAIAPNMPKPGLYAAVVGSYHCTGITLSSMIIFWLS